MKLVDTFQISAVTCMPQHQDKLEVRSLTGYRRNVPFSPLLHKPELLLFWKLPWSRCFTCMTVPTTRPLVAHDSTSFKRNTVVGTWQNQDWKTLCKSLASKYWVLKNFSLFYGTPQLISVHKSQLPSNPLLMHNYIRFLWLIFILTSHLFLDLQSLLLPVSYMPCISHPPWLDHFNYVWWTQ
jgi:hypothetical protein